MTRIVSRHENAFTLSVEYQMMCDESYKVSCILPLNLGQAGQHILQSKPTVHQQKDKGQVAELRRDYWPSGVLIEG